MIQVIKNKEDTNIKELVCDKKTDMTNIDLRVCGMGTTCFVIDEDKNYMLNSDKEWKKVSLAGASGGDSGEDRLGEFINRSVSGKIVIKEWPYYVYNGSTIHRFTNNQFSYQRNIEEIVLPNYIIEDEDMYFEDEVFKDCHSLKKIGPIPSNIKKIRPRLFMNCYNLEEIVLPEGLTSIYDGAFLGCSSLKEIVFPSTITYFNSAFSKSGLETLDIRPFAAKLPTNETFPKFNDMPNLKYVKLGGLRASYFGGFTNCPNIEKIVIPNGVTRIGTNDKTNAFAGTKIKDGLYLPYSIATIYAKAFTDLDSDIYCDFVEGKVPGAPWGGDASRIHYNVPLPTEE